jgi:riboflavin kinase/FMN adenylyltransferase
LQRQKNDLKIFSSIEKFTSNKKTIITIGTFDGVHVGHKKIIDRVVANASECDCESLILTFFPHPRMVLHGQDGIKLLNTLDEKKTLLEKAGLQNLIIHPFDEAFSRLTAEEFVKSVLVDRLNVHKIIIGHDHRFGRNRDAGIEDLIVFGEMFGFGVEQIPAEEIDAVSVSSTKIRNALSEGQMELANTFLGYDYFLSGTVILGKQLGRTIGFPTANIEISEEYKLIPQNGVYVVKGHIDGNSTFGMMNIGHNPTTGWEKLSIEVHFFDFDRDIYGQPITVSILHYLRAEHKFDSLDILKHEIMQDQFNALAFLSRA